MAYTGHGYHIPGTNKGEGVTRAVAPIGGCGGPQAGCPRCTKEAEEYLASVIGTEEDFQDKAKRIVREYIDFRRIALGMSPLEEFGLYVPWFSKILNGWKATVGTTRNDGWYFEVTYDGPKKRAYVDFYVKQDNIIVPD